MRSANKKAGTIGDIEVLAGQSGEILEAWDAKYGQPYLLDQLEELSEKLSSHAEVETAGFVVDREPDIRPDILERIEEVKADHDLDIAILSFEEWVGRQVERSGDIRGIGRCWILAYAETLCLSRTQRAPIDEPTEIWVRDLRELIKAE